MFWLLFWVLVVGGLFVWFLHDATKPTPWPTKPLPVLRKPLPVIKEHKPWSPWTESVVSIGLFLALWGLFGPSSHHKDGCDY